MSKKRRHRHLKEGETYTPPITSSWWQFVTGGPTSWRTPPIENAPDSPNDDWVYRRFSIKRLPLFLKIFLACVVLVVIGTYMFVIFTS